MLVENECPELTLVKARDIQRFFDRLGKGAMGIITNMLNNSLQEHTRIVDMVDNAIPESCPDDMFERNFSLLLAKIYSAAEDLKRVNAKELKRAKLSQIIVEAKVLLNKKYIRYSDKKVLRQTIAVEFSEITDVIS